MIDVVLYTKPGCHLCQTVRDDLDALAREVPLRIVEQDILEDADLFAQYQHLVPVVVIGHTRLVYPFSSFHLHAALAATRPHSS